jgi:putative ABC transport system permease protein
MLRTTLQLGIRNLMLHKLRSFLTMLGTILGVGSVIAMLAIGEGSKREAVEQIRQLGATNIILRSVKPDQDSGQEETTSGRSAQQTSSVLEFGLRYSDLERLVATLPTVERAVPLAVVRKNAQNGHHRISHARILGVTPEYRFVKSMELKPGSRFITQPDLRATRNIAILGAGAAQRLFSFHDPIGKQVLLGDGAYVVVGVLTRQDSGTATPGSGGEDQNNDIYIPITAAHRRFGELQAIIRAGGRDYERTQLSEITLTVNDESHVAQTAAMARQLLATTHPGGRDFEIQVPLELLRRAEQEKRIWNIVLGSIAGISLLVGGIGIMNIMLATVTERTREIGIRRALGAKRRDITAQFLVETIVLSAAGAAIGVVVGIALPVAVSMVVEIRTDLTWSPPFVAFAIAVLIGVVFGVYPARRAAMMDPIEALRHQ